MSIPLTLLINCIYCENTIATTKYHLTSDEIKTDLSFVLISDLHNKEFGKDNKRLVNTIKKQNPDFIAVVGDMTTREDPKLNIMTNLISQLSKLAPTYCCYGNHELSLKGEIDFISEVNKTGAVFLDNKSTTFEKNGEEILIGGLSDYPFYEFNFPEFDTKERYFWEEFGEKSKDHYTVLLHHQPEYISANAPTSDIDLILSGHTHGGVVRIPFIGGISAPNQGYFPEYDKGEYEFNHTKMIITSGLGNPNFVPRINNRAEICVININ